MNSLSGPVLVLGAGATKACNGPMTNDILFEADQAFATIEREGYLALVDSFLTQVFRVPVRPSRKKTSYPGLPLLLSLIDTAIDRGQPLFTSYDAAHLRDVRAAIEYAIFAILDLKLRSGIPPHHTTAIDAMFPAPAEPRVISLNYDMIADNALAMRSQGTFPDYGCEIQTETYRNFQKFGKLFKLHGSLNWLYCPNCNRLDVAVSRSGKSFSKALEQLYMSEGGETNDLDHRYSCHGSPCKACGTFVRPVMITPTSRRTTAILISPRFGIALKSCCAPPAPLSSSATACPPMT
jgi:ferredoxin